MRIGISTTIAIYVVICRKIERDLCTFQILLNDVSTDWKNEYTAQSRMSKPIPMNTPPCAVSKYRSTISMIVGTKPVSPKKEALSCCSMMSDTSKPLAIATIIARIGTIAKIREKVILLAVSFRFLLVKPRMTREMVRMVA